MSRIDSEPTSTSPSSSPPPLDDGLVFCLNMDALKVVYKEEFQDFVSARKREVYFKSAAGRRFLKNKLGH